MPHLRHDSQRRRRHGGFHGRGPTQMAADGTSPDDQPRARPPHQHPWEIIALYRGLLLWRCSEDAADAPAATGLRRGIAIATARQHGAVLRLIAAVIAVAGACCVPAEADFIASAQELLGDLATRLPNAAESIAALRAILDRKPAAHEALAVLPFNYR